MAFQKKVSPTADAVIGVAASSLKKSLVELKTSVDTLSTLDSKLEEYQLQIASKEQKIEELDVLFREKQRQHSVELEMKVKEDSLKLVKEVLASQQLVTVPEHELKELKEEILELQINFDDRVKKEVGAAAGAISSAHATKEKLLEAEYRAKEAGNLASIQSLTSQVANLTTQVEGWKLQLDKEREASVDRAKAGAIGAINIGANETGRR